MPASCRNHRAVHGARLAERCAHAATREERPHSSCERARRRCASGGVLRKLASAAAARGRDLVPTRGRGKRRGSRRGVASGARRRQCAMTLADYFRSLPLIARERHFNDPWVCQALCAAHAPRGSTCCGSAGGAAGLECAVVDAWPQPTAEARAKHAAALEQLEQLDLVLVTASPQWALGTRCS